MTDEQFTWFADEIKKVCRAGLDKGYDTHLGSKSIYESLGSVHALGEIVLKVQRFSRKRNPEDLIKIAAWAAFLYTWEREKDLEIRNGAIKAQTGHLHPRPFSEEDE
jgi:hypothetical protein